MTGNLQLNELEPYLPSSSEKKQAVMMYMMVGLALSRWKWEVSPYTHHHIKQSLGWLVFLALIVFADLALVILWLILHIFLWLAALITIPALTIWAMWIYQAQQGKYIRENEIVNKFFLFFSGIWNWVLNLFDANHYQIIDWERYRTEDQFYPKPEKKEEKSDTPETPKTVEVQTEPVAQENDQSTTTNIDSLDIQNHEINNEPIDWKSLDNDQQISINNQDIWIDLSGHEINNPENLG